jgi:hypothetical protein
MVPPGQAVPAFRRKERNRLGWAAVECVGMGWVLVSCRLGRGSGGLQQRRGAGCPCGHGISVLPLETRTSVLALKETRTSVLTLRGEYQRAAGRSWVPLTPRKPNSCLVLPVTACPLHCTTYAGHFLRRVSVLRLGDERDPCRGGGSVLPVLLPEELEERVLLVRYPIPEEPPYLHAGMPHAGVRSRLRPGDLCFSKKQATSWAQTSC